MNCLESMVIAFAMYSKIPMPKILWNKDNMKYVMCFFPMVGIVIGAIVWFWAQLSSQIEIGSLFQTIVFVLIPILLTGGIHMDGFLDTVDALSSYQPKEKRLEILKDSRSGAFAILFGMVYLLSMVAVWSELQIKGITILCIGFVLSRALSGYGVAVLPCAKNSGLAATFSEKAQKKRTKIVLLLEIFFLAMIMMSFDLRLGAFACAAALLLFFYYKWMAEEKFGGITGDLAGWFLQMVELFMALAVMIGEKL